MKLAIYRVFSFLLLPMAIVYSISVLLFLRAAFANPVLLAFLFLFSCISIYSFASLNFLIRGVDGKKLLGRSSKDWIIINGLIALVAASILIAQRVAVLMNPEILKNFADQMKKNIGAESKWKASNFENLLLVSSYFLIAYAVVLLVHIIISFQYIKTYNYLFQNETK